MCTFVPFRKAVLILALTIGAAQIGTEARAAAAIPDDVRNANGIIYVVPGGTGNFGNALIYLDEHHVDTIKTNYHAAIIAVPGKHEISTAGRRREVFRLDAEAGRSYYLKLAINAEGMPEFTLMSETEGQQAVAQSQPSRAPTYASSGLASSAPVAQSRRPRTSRGERQRRSPGMYIGVGPGMATATGLNDELTIAAESLQDLADVLYGPGAASTTARSDNTDAGVKLFFGYAFSKSLTLEAYYADLGNYSITAVADDGVDQLTSKGTWAASGFGASAIIAFPLSDWFALFGKLGFVAWNLEYKLTLNDTSSGFNDSITEKKSGTSPLFGVGADIDLSGRWALRAEYERYVDIGDRDVTGQFDIDLISVNAILRF